MNKIKEIRLKQNLSQKDFAEAMGVFPPVVAALEKVEIPTIENLVKASVVLECNWWELVTDTKEEYQPIDYLIFDISNRIKEVRKAKGITATGLYTKLGIPQSSLSRTEKTNNIPKLERLLEISNALDCSIKDLIKIEEVVIDMRSEAGKVYDSFLKKMKDGYTEPATEEEFCAAMGAIIALMEKPKYEGRKGKSWTLTRYGLVNQNSKEKVREKLAKWIRINTANLTEEEQYLRDTAVLVISFNIESDKFTAVEKDAFILGITHSI